MKTFLDYLTRTLEHDTLLDLAGARHDFYRQGCGDGNPGLTNTADLVLLYDTYQVEIFDAISKDAEDLGYSNLVEFVSTFRYADGMVDSDTFKERLVWWMVEREAGRYADACENEEVV